MIWWSLISCTLDSSEAIENWQNRMHKVSMRKFPRIIRSMRQVGVDTSDLPTYEGVPNLACFQSEFEAKVAESQRLSSLDFALKATSAKWWGTHK